ncbi:hypothetical protein DI487_10325 [Flavobacterium sediminis]|uniref:RES domain-containing protein n=1 Tax=Flavobacterium sediminis TaxID=2201181 RepID=A0A2U8QVL6_9FLAO|nr:hypothetical protein [Flavobacterium sediminis]AWM14208.1 hypothetical protein DI487_10325 [Flavobacterium sediminis]
MAKLFRDAVDKIKPLLTEEIFKIPIEQKGSNSFPTFLKEELDKYAKVFEKTINPIIEEYVEFESLEKGIILNKIKQFSNSLLESINLHYQGKVLESIEIFNNSLKEILFEEINTSDKIAAGRKFYRARKDNESHFTSADLFHIKFEDRIHVTTKRYSIPGFPALYLGESTYVCWEEFDRTKFRSLWFSKFKNTVDLKIILIERLEDFLTEIEKVSKDFQLTFILRYLVTFPLSIACSIKVKNTKANFKPEYVIPQLLLQYVSKDDNFDGIKFPSTKINYSKLKNVPSYNFVFPIKTNKEKGYCDFLTSAFELTEPTSLEIEEVIDNPHNQNTVHGYTTYNEEKHFEIIEGLKTVYDSSAFGKIEKRLNVRDCKKISNE